MKVRALSLADSFISSFQRALSSLLGTDKQINILNWYVDVRHLKGSVLAESDPLVNGQSTSQLCSFTILDEYVLLVWPSQCHVALIKTHKSLELRHRIRGHNFEIHTILFPWLITADLLVKSYTDIDFTE